MNTTLRLVNEKTLNLCDSLDNIILRQKPRWTKFEQVKRIKDNCNIVKESDDNFPKDINGKANIYCLDDTFGLKWTLDAPFENDTFPNPIVWDKATLRRKNKEGYLTLNIVDNPKTFICSSWKGITVTVDYDTGQIISSEFTK